MPSAQKPLESQRWNGQRKTVNYGNTLASEQSTMPTDINVKSVGTFI